MINELKAELFKDFKNKDKKTVCIDIMNTLIIKIDLIDNAKIE